MGVLWHLHEFGNCEVTQSSEVSSGFIMFLKELFKIFLCLRDEFMYDFLE